MCWEINAADQAFADEACVLVSPNLGPCVTAFYTSRNLKSKPEVVAIKTTVNIFCWHFSSREPMEAGISACSRSNRWKYVGVHKA